VLEISGFCIWSVLDNDTGEILIAGVVETGEQLIAGFVDTCDKHSFANISANLLKKFETALMEYSGAEETLIHEKNLKSKISCQTPFKIRCMYRSVPLDQMDAP
jgi:hypothetical protein